MQGRYDDKRTGPYLSSWCWPWWNDDNLLLASCLFVIFVCFIFIFCRTTWLLKRTPAQTCKHRHRPGARRHPYAINVQKSKRFMFCASITKLDVLFSSVFSNRESMHTSKWWRSCRNRREVSLCYWPVFWLIVLSPRCLFLSDKYDRCISSCAVCSEEIRTS